MEINTDDNRPQNFPITQSKLDSYAKRMETHENFLKYNNVLTKKPLITFVGDLYPEYTSCCDGMAVKPLSKAKIDLGKKLREIG